MIESLLKRLNAIPGDKWAHFATGAIGFAIALPFAGPRGAFIAVVIVGFAKELYDTYKQGHTPDVVDAFATCLGGALGYFIREVSA